MFPKHIKIKSLLKYKSVCGRKTSGLSLTLTSNHPTFHFFFNLNKCIVSHVLHCWFVIFHYIRITYIYIYTYTICVYVFWILILQLKSWYKAIHNRLKILQAVATESWNFRSGWWTDNQIFRKMHRFKAAILLYLSLMVFVKFSYMCQNIAECLKLSTAIFILAVSSAVLVHDVSTSDDDVSMMIAVFLIGWILLMPFEKSSDG